MDVRANFDKSIVNDISLNDNQIGLNNSKLDWDKQVRNVLATKGEVYAGSIVTTNNITVTINGKQYKINVLPL
jgi:trehalose-6-phosphatase